MGIQWGDAATWFGAGGAFVMSGAALWVSVRGQRAANDAALRSADAAERATVVAEEQAARYEVPWLVRAGAKGQYILINESDEYALDVEIHCENVIRIDGETNHSRISPGSAVALRISRSWQKPGDDFTVTWRRPSENDRRAWTHPLPSSHP